MNFRILDSIAEVKDGISLLRNIIFMQENEFRGKRLLKI
jgi:hypothetical protein